MNKIIIGEIITPDEEESREEHIKRLENQNIEFPLKLLIGLLFYKIFIEKNKVEKYIYDWENEKIYFIPSKIFINEAKMHDKNHIEGKMTHITFNNLIECSEAQELKIIFCRGSKKAFGGKILKLKH